MEEGPSRQLAVLLHADVVEIARRRGLANHKWPERLEILESLPLTPAGKIQRTAVRELARERIEAGGEGEHPRARAPSK